MDFILGAFVGGISLNFGLIDAHSVQEHSLFLSLFSSFVLKSVILTAWLLIRIGLDSTILDIDLDFKLQQENLLLDFRFQNSRCFGKPVLFVTLTLKDDINLLSPNNTFQ